jgi:thymidylate synthase
MNPEEDYEGHMPCIISLDFKIRNEQLDITGFFRSQDIGKKIYADILALNAILTEVSEKIKVKSGDVKIFISSAHIYEQDYNKFND